MKLLLDEGLPSGSAARLREAGLDATHVLEAGLGGRADREILAHALDLGAAVVTLDSDFHAILADQGASGPSVIRRRIEGLDAPAASQLIQQVIESADTAIAAGCVVSVVPTGIRIRELPLKS